TLLKQGALPIKRAFHITRQILLGLREIHEKDFVHRDLNPSNIFLLDGTPSDSLKIIDFGIAKLSGDDKRPLLTGTGKSMGTAAYMAPEQTDLETKEQIDGRADLYAVGLMLYEMLAGYRPFPLKADATTKERVAAAMKAHRHLEPIPLRITHGNGLNHARLIDLVHCALAKNPDDRPQSAEVFLKELEDLASPI
ncbi:MAG: serine/threonine protein kinase, partial [Deltaproteobacteria bacterium]|nr:serine/threonine protein kinase [Deltaproteobacteria bacterium]